MHDQRVTAADVDPEPTWLVVDSRRLTFAEYRRLSPNLLTLVFASVLKLLRRRIRFPSALPREFRLIDLAGAAPSWAEPALTANHAAFVAGGLRPVLTYTIPMLGPTTTVARVFVDDAGDVVAQAMVGRTVGQPPRTTAFCTSHLADGAVLATGNHQEHLANPPTVRAELLTGDAAHVLARHRARLAGLAITPCPRDQLTARLAAEHALAVAFHEARGAYVPIDADQLASLRTATPPPELPPAIVVRR